MLGKSSLPPFISSYFVRQLDLECAGSDGLYLISHSAAFPWNCIPTCQPRDVAQTLRDDSQRRA